MDREFAVGVFCQLIRRMNKSWVWMHVLGKTKSEIIFLRVINALLTTIGCVGYFRIHRKQLYLCFIGESLPFFLSSSLWKSPFILAAWNLPVVEMISQFTFLFFKIILPLSTNLSTDHPNKVMSTFNVEEKELIQLQLWIIFFYIRPATDRNMKLCESCTTISYL